MPTHDPIPPSPAPRPAPPPWPAPPEPPPRVPIANPHAWARFRRVMVWMTAIALLCAGAAIGWLAWSGTPLHLHMVIATVLGVFFTMLVGTGLMTLSFLSAGSGHDEEAARPPDR